MHLLKDTWTLVFENGREVPMDTLSLQFEDGEPIILYGSDGGIDHGKLTHAERIEMADYMLALWQQFKDWAEAERAKSVL